MIKKLLEFFHRGVKFEREPSCDTQGHEQYHENVILADPWDALSPYMSLSSQIMEARGDEEKLRLCRLALAEFPNFVSRSFALDGDLPPVVLVRDLMPELLMRYGLWEEAEDVIRLCISCGSYGHTEYQGQGQKGVWIQENGDPALYSLSCRHSAADALLSYLRSNPGTLQRTVYKIPELSSCDHDALVWFCRLSHQIRKEKAGKTNRLYVAGDDAK